jgi:ubiquinone/menaquinone biosynthesis C-methylase UbiE
MTAASREQVIDFENPPKLFLIEDRFKAVLGGPLFFNPIFRRCGGFRGNERVLDFGCGGGVSTRCIAKQLNRGGSVTGVDISSLMVGRAERRLRRFPNATVVRGELPSIDIEDAAFDIATMVYVIHDIPRSKRPEVAGALADKLKTGGTLWVLEPTKPGHGISVAELKGLMADSGLVEVSSEVKKTTYRGEFLKR